MQEVIVRKAAAGKVARFFPWVYDNEIDRLPRKVDSGEVVRVVSPSGGFLGIGYINPANTIAIRILSFTERTVNLDFLREKISMSWQRRADLMAQTNACRAVYSEADDLPGLIVDHYNGYLSLQINTAGMERLRDGILSALVEMIRPRGIYERSDAGAREKEGLRTAEGVLYGNIPDTVLIEEHGIRFHVQLRGGQKTGFYLDQRRNRRIVASHVGKGFDVLDVFSNTGGFGLHAAMRGAKAVILVDQSASAIAMAEENIRLNHLKNVTAVKAEAFDYLAAAPSKGTRYDLMILDPPAFAKTKGAKAGALKGYRRLALGGLKILGSGGRLAFFSCSHHISREDLECVLMEAAAEADCRVEVLEYLFQDHDHPYLLNVPQSLYLKGLFLRKSSP